MNGSDDTVFGERFQTFCPEKVYEIRQALRQDVRQTEGQIISLKSYNKYLAILPSLNHVGQELPVLFKDRYVDLDMQNDLERSEVLNWCRTTKVLYPVRTTADGNCLLHAVSQALWGMEDTDCFLRRLVYANLVTDPNEAFTRRWTFHHRNSEDLQRLDVRLNTGDCYQEWEVVIKATDDLSNSQTHGLPYTALESIHLYVAANVLKRPIIVIADPMARNVFGQTMQDNKLNGIYLPLEWSAEHCHKSPILIGYSLNHFAPLLFEEDSAKGDRNRDHMVCAVPLVTKAMDSLPVRFLMPNEESNIGYIMSSYLHTTEVFYNTTPVPAAKVKPHSLPNTVNIIEACALDCERKFRRLRGEEVPPIAPFNFQVAEVAPVRPMASASQRLNTVTSQNHHGSQQVGRGQKCGTLGCTFFANPEYGRVCTKCFNDFTIQYARQEEVAKRIGNQLPVLPIQRIPLSQPVAQLPVPPPQPARQTTGNYHDLSMIGEDCQANCGFKCSTETYPYCHECFPKFNNTGAAPQQRQEYTPPTQSECSMLPENCAVAGCEYKCSKATSPYCHSCFSKFNSPNVAPSAPPPSLPGIGTSRPNPGTVGSVSTTNRLELKLNVSTSATNQTPHSDRTAVSNMMRQMDIQNETGTLNKKCRTVHCQNNAIKGNDGFCDTCYNVTLFGTGGASPGEQQRVSGKCLSPGCEVGICLPETTQCLQCFLKAEGTLSGHLQSLTGSRPIGMNIVPTPEHKILNSTQTQTSPITPPPAHSMSAEHDETVQQAKNQVATSAVIAQQAKEEAKYHANNPKYICATPGCSGQRIEGLELCVMCVQGQGPAAPSPSAESLEESCSHSLSREEMRRLNPVVVSSRDKVKCAYASCEKLIYPPKKLCDECSAALEKFRANKSRELNITAAGANSQCKTPGCTFFGSTEWNGYCSSCFKAQVPVLQERFTVPLASKPQPSQPKNTTVPLASAISPAGPIGGRGKPCIEPNCTRFGDPSQADRCSEHYEKAMAKYPPISANSLEEQPGIVQQEQQQPQNYQRQTGTATTPLSRSYSENYRRRTNPNFVGSRSEELTPPQQPTGNTRHSDITEEDQFVHSYSKLFSSKKSTAFCRNHATSGCLNFGNSTKQGYCNTCYSEITSTNGLLQNSL